MSSAQVIGGIVGLVCFVYVTVDAWRSPASTGTKVGWTVFSFFCTLIALIVWLVTGRKKAYNLA